MFWHWVIEGEKLPVVGSVGRYFINLIRLRLTRLQPNKN